MQKPERDFRKEKLSSRIESETDTRNCEDKEAIWKIHKFTVGFGGL